MVGIGVPLILVILALIYMFCIQSSRTDFIDSDGKVVTAYRANKFTKWWYMLLGKKVSDEYHSDSPLGGSASSAGGLDLDEADDVMEQSSLFDVRIRDSDSVLPNANTADHNNTNSGGEPINSSVASNDIILTANHWAALCSLCTTTLCQRPPRTSELSVPARRASATPAAHSTE